MKKTTVSGRAICAAAVAATVLAAGTTGAAAAARPDYVGPKVGTLTCRDVPGMAGRALFGSERAIKCVFTDFYGNSVKYKGSRGIALGVDLDGNRDEEVTFTVFSTYLKTGSHQLAGEYSGVEVSATFGIGAGVVLLVGGGDHNISLKPAGELSTGIGFKAGFAFLRLTADK